MRLQTLVSRQVGMVVVGVMSFGLLVMVVVSGSWTFGGRSQADSVEYSAAHRQLAEEVRTVLAEDPGAFAPADRTILGKLDYLADVGYVIEGTVVDLSGPPVEIVDGLSIYDPSVSELPTAIVDEARVVRRYDDLAGDPVESMISAGDEIAIEFGSGVVEVGRRYSFFVTANGYAMLIVDAASEAVVEGSFHPSNNGAKAMARLLELNPGASPGSEVLALADEFHQTPASPAANSRLGQLLGESLGNRGEASNRPQDRYPTIADPVEAASLGLVPFEILILGSGNEPASTIFSLRGKKDLDSWATIHEERHYAILAGYVEPGDSIQLLTKGSREGPARPLASLGVPGNKIQLPEDTGPGGMAVIVDLRPGVTNTVRVFSDRESYRSALDPLMPIINVAEVGPEPEVGSDSEAPPSGPRPDGGRPTTTVPPPSTTRP